MSAAEHDGPTEAERAEALALLSLLRDGRPVDAEAAARARALAASDPEVGAMLAAWERQAALLAGEPALRAPADFTERVVAATRQDGGGELLTLPVARRLALAAALLLAVTLGWSLARPGTLRADPDLQRHRHAVDHFRATPFGHDDILRGLRGRLNDPEANLPHVVVPTESRR